MTDVGHAFFAPSGAPEWGHCSGAALARAMAPDVETQKTLEGNAAHWVVAETLAVWRDGGVAVVDDFLEQTAPNGTVIDQEMVDSARIMVADVLDICQQYGGLRNLLVEYRVHMPTIHSSRCWGTLDVALDLRHLGHVYLWDYKHGHGGVSPFENLQLVSYFEGLRNEWDVNGGDTMHGDQRITLHGRICQPRNYRATQDVNEWTVTWSDLRPLVNKLSAQAHEAENNPQMVAGAHCRYCPARIRCEAAREYGYYLIDHVCRPFAIDTLDGAALAVEREILKAGATALSSRLDAIEDELELRIAGGERGTGLALETGQGRNKWTVPVPQVVAFGAQFGVDISKPDVMTPTQAAASVPAEIRQFFKEAMKSVTRRGTTGLKLVPAQDSRTSRAFKRSK